MSPRPSVEIVCLKVGHPILNIRFSIMQSGVYACFLMGKIGYGLLGELEEGRDLTVVFFHHLN